MGEGKRTPLWGVLELKENKESFKLFKKFRITTFFFFVQSLSSINMPFCSECGAKLEGLPKFCPECGNKFKVTYRNHNKINNLLLHPIHQLLSPTSPRPINSHELGIKLEEVVESIFKADGYSTQKRQRIPGIRVTQTKLILLLHGAKKKLQLNVKIFQFLSGSLKSEIFQ